jgi:hypothetical protein
MLVTRTGKDTLGAPGTTAGATPAAQTSRTETRPQALIARSMRMESPSQLLRRAWSGPVKSPGRAGVRRRSPSGSAEHAGHACRTRPVRWSPRCPRSTEYSTAPLATMRGIPLCCDRDGLLFGLALAHRALTMSLAEPSQALPERRAREAHCRHRGRANSIRPAARGGVAASGRRSLAIPGMPHLAHRSV